MTLLTHFRKVNPVSLWFHEARVGVEAPAQPRPGKLLAS